MPKSLETATNKLNKQQKTKSAANHKQNKNTRKIKKTAKKPIEQRLDQKTRRMHAGGGASTNSSVGDRRSVGCTH
jgi:hypothetical protein